MFWVLSISLWVFIWFQCYFFVIEWFSARNGTFHDFKMRYFSSLLFIILCECVQYSLLSEFYSVENQKKFSSFYCFKEKNGNRIKMFSKRGSPGNISQRDYKAKFQEIKFYLYRPFFTCPKMFWLDSKSI